MDRWTENCVKTGLKRGDLGSILRQARLKPLFHIFAIFKHFQIFENEHVRKCLVYQMY